MKPPIVMVHGAFCGGWSFDRFRRPFEAAGHEVIAIDLPGHGARVEEGVAGLSMADYVRATARACEVAAQAAGGPPILLGHSLGGLVAALAAGRAPVARLILLAPSSPWGVIGSSLEEAGSAVSLYALGPFWLQAVPPDYVIARRFSFDRMPRIERRAVFARMGSESGRALWETLNWWMDPFMTTRLKTVAAPALCLSGGKDVIHPPATVKQIAERLSAAHQTFPEMSHWLPAEPGWEAVASACLDWLATEAKAAA